MKAWAEKLRLALRAASFVRLTREQSAINRQHDGDNEEDDDREIILPNGFFGSNSQVRFGCERDFRSTFELTNSIFSVSTDSEFSSLLLCSGCSKHNN
jgi:hypothetical protein